MRTRYPFEALHWLRKKRVDQAAAEVAERARETARARDEEASARAARRGVEQSMAEVERAERARLAEGGLRAHELAVAAEFQRGARLDLERRQAREQHARELSAAKLVAEGAARQALGRASAAAEVIDTHRVRFRSAESSAQARAEEEAAEEQWTAKRYPPRRA